MQLPAAVYNMALFAGSTTSNIDNPQLITHNSLPSPKPPLNPFHFLLGLMGIIFTMTAIGYTVLIVREEKLVWQQPASSATANASAEPDMRDHPLLKLLSAHGMGILLSEIGVIAVLTAAAIGLDRWRDLRAEKAKLTASEEKPSENSR